MSLFRKIIGVGALAIMALALAVAPANALPDPDIFDGSLVEEDPASAEGGSVLRDILAGEPASEDAEETAQDTGNQGAEGSSGSTGEAPAAGQDPADSGSSGSASQQANTGSQPQSGDQPGGAAGAGAAGQQTAAGNGQQSGPQRAGGGGSGGSQAGQPGGVTGTTTGGAPGGTFPFGGFPGIGSSGEAIDGVQGGGGAIGAETDTPREVKSGVVLPENQQRGSATGRETTVTSPFPTIGSPGETIDVPKSEQGDEAEESENPGQIIRPVPGNNSGGGGSIERGEATPGGI